MAGPWEVEQKFIVSDVGSLLERLEHLGAAELPTESHVDIYLAHPCRDFKATDEAFRLRKYNSQACVTYKGKRLPGNVKTRPEIELYIEPSEIDQWLEMMQLLGFQAKPKVLKTRRVFSVFENPQVAKQTPFTIALDEVVELGAFAEVELLVDDPQQLEAARARIEAMANLLGLTNVQPRSYLSLLLAKLGVE